MKLYSSLCGLSSICRSNLLNSFRLFLKAQREETSVSQFQIPFQVLCHLAGCKGTIWARGPDNFSISQYTLENSGKQRIATSRWLLFAILQALHWCSEVIPWNMESLSCFGQKGKCIRCFFLNQSEWIVDQIHSWEDWFLAHRYSRGSHDCLAPCTWTEHPGSWSGCQRSFFTSVWQKEIEWRGCRYSSGFLFFPFNSGVGSPWNGAVAFRLDLPH